MTIVDETRAPLPGDARLPQRISRIDLKGVVRLQAGRLHRRARAPLVPRRGARRSRSTACPAASIVNNDDVRVERLAVRTAESSLSARGAIRDYLGTPTLDLTRRLGPADAARARRLRAVARDVKVEPAFELTARGRSSALDTTLAVRSDAGNVRGRLVADADGPDARCARARCRSTRSI